MRSGARLTREDLQVAIDTLARAGGQVVAVSDTDAGCAVTARMPWPPHPNVLEALNLVGHGWVLDWVPYGVPTVDHVHVRLRDRADVLRT